MAVLTSLHKDHYIRCRGMREEVTVREMPAKVMWSYWYECQTCDMVMHSLEAIAQHLMLTTTPEFIDSVVKDLADSEYAKIRLGSPTAGENVTIHNGTSSPIQVIP